MAEKRMSKRDLRDCSERLEAIETHEDGDDWARRWGAVLLDEVDAEKRTKREYFAAMMMQATLSNSANDQFGLPETASDAVRAADALLDALAKPREEEG